MYFLQNPSETSMENFFFLSFQSIHLYTFMSLDKSFCENIPERILTSIPYQELLYNGKLATYVQQSMFFISVFVNKVLLAYSHAYLFIYYLWFL